MSNRRSPRQLTDELDAKTGHRIPGGCDDCDAYQTMTKQDGIYHVTVHHDDTCPWLRARTTR